MATSIRVQSSAPRFMLFPLALFSLVISRLFPELGEEVTGTDGTFRITQDVDVSSGAEFWGSFGKDGKNTIAGKLEYQTCDRQAATCRTRLQ